MKNDFSALTGADINIGIIDSGYSPGGRTAHIAAGADFSVPDSTAPGDDFRDCIGHGTACAGIIARKASEATIYPVKVFADELISDVERLAQALTWCIDHKLQLVNLSLGTTEVTAEEQLRKLCDRALEENVIVVAATDNGGQRSYPSSLPDVFGVAAGKVRGKHSYYFDPDQEVQFVARGDPQRLDWIDGGQVFTGGTSFAAPHITGILALLLQQYPGIQRGELLEVLKAHSLPQRPPPSEQQDSPFSARPAAHNNVRLRDVCSQNDVRWINKAVIYPYNKEMHGLVRFRDLLPFDITHVVDVAGKRMTGKDSGEAIGAEKSGIMVQRKLEECLPDVDTLVLGYVDELSRIKKRDVLAEILQLALQHGKNVYSLTPVVDEVYPGVEREFAQRGLHLGSPVVSATLFERLSQSFDWRESSRKPIVGVFGTSAQQGKFTAQLALRRELQKIGYKVGQLGTEHQAALFGFDFTFPNGYDGLRNIQLTVSSEWH